MKKAICLVLALLLVLLAGILPGYAYGAAYHGGGGWHGGYHGGGYWRGGVWIGPGWGWGPWWGAGYPYYPYYPYYPGYSGPAVVQQQPQEYIQQTPQPEQQSYWYFCPNPQGYYPYIKKCPKGWMKVIPAPAPQGGEE